MLRYVVRDDYGRGICLFISSPYTAEQAIKLPQWFAAAKLLGGAQAYDYNELVGEELFQGYRMDAEEIAIAILLLQDLGFTCVE